MAVYKKYFPEWTFRDFFNEVLVPVIFAIVILLMGTVVRFATASNPALSQTLTFGFIESIMVIGLPVLLGVGWSRWAGAASGFLLSWIYVMSSHALFNAKLNPSYIGYIVAAMMIGYMAGTLNHGSQSIKRVVYSSLIAAWSMCLIYFIPFLIYAKGGMYITYGSPSGGYYGPFLGWGGEASNIWQLWMNHYWLIYGLWGLEGGVFGRILMMMRPQFGGGANPHQDGSTSETKKSDSTSNRVLRIFLEVGGLTLLFALVGLIVAFIFAP